MGKLGSPTALDHAMAAYSMTVGSLDRTTPDSWSYVLGGSCRRRKEIVSDVDLLIVAPVMQLTDDPTWFEPQWHVTPKTAILVVCGVRVEAWWCPPESLGPMLQFVTGPGDLNVFLRRQAQKRGLKLSQYGLLTQGGERLDDNTEESIFDCLDVAYIEPTARDSWTERIGEQKWR